MITKVPRYNALSYCILKIPLQTDVRARKCVTEEEREREREKEEEGEETVEGGIGRRGEGGGEGRVTHRKPLTNTGVYVALLGGGPRVERGTCDDPYLTTSAKTQSTFEANPWKESRGILKKEDEEKCTYVRYFSTSGRAHSVSWSTSLHHAYVYIYIYLLYSTPRRQIIERKEITKKKKKKKERNKKRPKRNDSHVSERARPTQSQTESKVHAGTVPTWSSQQRAINSSLDARRGSWANMRLCLLWRLAVLSACFFLRFYARTYTM